MDEYSPLECFLREWTCYLEQHGHQVRQHPGQPDVVLSVNGRRTRYRWLIRCTEDDSLLLTAARRKEIRRQNRLARNAGEQCFLVVKFGHPGGHAVVVPAGQAIRLRGLSAEKGGIPWDC